MSQLYDNMAVKQCNMSFLSNVITTATAIRLKMFSISCSFFFFFFLKMWQNFILAPREGQRPFLWGILDPPLLFLYIWFRSLEICFCFHSIQSMKLKEIFFFSLTVTSLNFKRSDECTEK